MAIIIDINKLAKQVSTNKTDISTLTSQLALPGGSKDLKAALDAKADKTEIPEVIAAIETNNTTKAVSSKAVADYIDDQGFADGSKVGQFENDLETLKGLMDDIDADSNLPKLADFMGDEEIVGGENTLKDITDAIKGFEATNHPIQQTYKSEYPESTYGISSAALDDYMEEVHLDSSNGLHLENNQAALLEAFFEDYEPDNEIGEGEALKDIVAKLSEHDASIATKADASKVTEIESALKDKADSDDLDDYATVSALTTHTSNNDIHVSAEQKAAIAKVAQIESDLATKANSSDVESKIANLATVYAPIAHVSETDKHFGTGEKAKFTSIIEDYDGTTSLNDLKEEVEGIVIPTVDQTYSSISTNAQSGIAVADAIKDKADKSALASLVTKEELSQHTLDDDVHLSTAQVQAIAKISNIETQLASKAESSVIATLATKEELKAYATSESVTTQLATKANKSDFDELKNKVEAIDIPSIEGLASEEYVDDEVEKLETKIKALEAKITELTSYIDNNFIKGAVVTEDTLPDEGDQVEDWNYIVRYVED